jgi:hypothetical protein
MEKGKVDLGAEQLKGWENIFVVNDKGRMPWICFS